jgi:hypothetical protein
VSNARRAVVVYLVLCAVGLAAIVGVIYRASVAREAGSAQSVASASEQSTAAAATPGPRLYFRSSYGDSFGKLAYVDSAAPANQPVVVELPCAVVHASGGRGICMAADTSLLTPFVAKLFDLADHAVRHTLPLGGLPSRTRVARSGRIGATTVFVSGHGYDSVDFSTQTLLLDLEAGTTIADVETFEFSRDGAVVREADFNVWGVTFLDDDNVFYATLSTQRQHLLVRGDVRARRAQIVHENVECPSVSPDGTRVAYKRRYLENNFVRWQLYVLDLRTGAETPLGEHRSVDDQLEWLDNERVLYTLIDTTGSVGNSVWSIAADGSGAAQMFVAGAASPALVR